jgi:arginine decarboxylase
VALPVKNKYIDLINQTFYFPRHGFEVRNNNLFFHDVDLMEVIREYGTPLKFTYLPKIGSQIDKARTLFNQAIDRYGYTGKYYYCYCTKSSHFSFVLDEVLKNDADIETSSAFDLDLLSSLHAKVIKRMLMRTRWPSLPKTALTTWCACSTILKRSKY